MNIRKLRILWFHLLHTGRFTLRNIMHSRICRKYGQSKRISALPIRIHRCDCAHVRNASSSVPVRGMCHASSASRYSRLAFCYQWFDQLLFWCSLLTILTIATLVNWQKIVENWEKSTEIAQLQQGISGIFGARHFGRFSSDAIFSFPFLSDRWL